MKRFALFIILSFSYIGLYSQPVYLTDSFPSISKRISFFEEKMNSESLDVKMYGLQSILYFYDVPDAELDRFLNYIIENEKSPELIGEAIKKRYDLFLDISNTKLPKKFCGYHSKQIIDLSMNNTIQDLIKCCYIPKLSNEKEKKKIIKKKEENNQYDTSKTVSINRQKTTIIKPLNNYFPYNTHADPGYCAYVIDVIKCKEAEKALIHLYENTNNIFVEYTVARALVSIGNKDIGIEFLKEIVGDYFIIKPKTIPEYDAYYVIASCWSISFEDKEYSINNLIKVYESLEKSADINAGSRLNYLRSVLANLTGKFFISYQDAKIGLK